MVPRLAIAAILLLAATFSSYAHDSDRIDQLEREVQETKERLSILESKLQNNSDENELEATKERLSILESELQNKSDENELVFSDDGWKNVANWRKLSSGMSELSVKKILGDPHKVVGAKNAVWYYDNGGVVRMIDGNLYGWSKPE